MKFPRRIKRRGHVLPTIYAKQKYYPFYRLASRINGQRLMRHFRTCTEANREGKKLVKDLAKGSQVAALTAAQARDALVALEPAAGLLRFNWASRIAAGWHTRDDSGLGCWFGGLSVQKDRFLGSWSESHTRSQGNQSLLTRIFHTPMETPTLRRVRARGLQARITPKTALAINRKELKEHRERNLC